MKHSKCIRIYRFLEQYLVVEGYLKVSFFEILIIHKDSHYRYV